MKLAKLAGTEVPSVLFSCNLKKNSQHNAIILEKSSSFGNHNNYASVVGFSFFKTQVNHNACLVLSLISLVEKVIDSFLDQSDCSIKQRAGLIANNGDSSLIGD